MRTWFIGLAFLWILNDQGIAQYTWLNPLPQGNTLHAVFAIDSLNCWAAGGYGTIMKTTDGGIEWSVINCATTESFSSICFIDQMNGWACTYEGKIFHSIDGGNTWELNYVSFDNSGYYSIDFTDDLHGCVVGGAYTRAEILMTWDGGEQWWIMKNELQGGRLWDVCFTDYFHGWTVSDKGNIYHTNDGGINWLLQFNAGILVDFRNIFFTDQLFGWAVGGGKIFSTDDGGKSWISNNLNFTLTDIFFVDSTTGYACGIDYFNNVPKGFVKKTLNGGITWGNTKWFEVNYLYSIVFESKNRGWVVGTSGAVFCTEDGNQSWSPQTFEFTRDHLTDSESFEEGSIGWASGRQGTILHTHNYGNTWEQQTTGVNAFLNAVDFTDTLNGWACGTDATLLHTMNGGSSWQKIDIPTFATCRDLSFPDPNHGIIVCDSGTILRTNNGGENWFKTDEPYGIFFQSVFFLDSLTGWITGYNNRNDKYTFIMRTSNGGNDWDIVYINQKSFLYKIYFVNEFNGWAVGSDSLIVRTIDGGATWISQSCPYAEYIWTVYFIDEDNGIIGGSNGILMTTIDGGETFELLSSGTNELIRASFVNSEGDVWTVGYNGCIIYHPQILTEINIPAPITDSKRLAIYPNPSISHAIISYKLNYHGEVNISLYSIIGENIMFYNGIQEQGNHEYYLDITSLPTGIYICEVKTSSQRMSGKLIIIR